jgi:hypothetical protein
MSRATFTIAYDGPALRDGAMDVRDLAPALLAAGQILDAANSVINSDNTKVKVQVTATGAGSFQISFELIQTLEEHLVAFLTSGQVTAATNLVTLVFGAPAVEGLIWLIRAARGKRPNKVERLSPDTVRLTFDDESLDVSLSLLKLFQDIPVRTAAQRLVEEPLQKPGIDLFEVIKDSRIAERVEKREAAYFARPHVPDEVLIDEIRRSAYSIVSLAFKEDNKWRLNDGSSPPISATISDGDFLTKVDNDQISFSKGDILMCDVRVMQKQTEQGLKTEYTVMKVVEHRLAARQLPLLFHEAPAELTKDPPAAPHPTLAPPASPAEK